MLIHAGEFLNRWKFLGRVGESKLESIHKTVNSLYHHHYYNLGNAINTRLLHTLESIVYDICNPLCDKLSM